MKIMSVILLMVLSASASSAATFTLSIGESFTFEADQFTIKLAAIDEDSRCPRELECFWEGDAAVALTAGAQDFTLHTAFTFQHSREISGYTIRLDTVAPYPTNESPIDPATYQVTITATKSAALPARASTWGAIKTIYR